MFLFHPSPAPLRSFPRLDCMNISSRGFQEIMNSLPDRSFVVFFWCTEKSNEVWAVSEWPVTVVWTAAMQKRCRNWCLAAFSRIIWNGMMICILSCTAVIPIGFRVVKVPINPVAEGQLSAFRSLVLFQFDAVVFVVVHTMTTLKYHCAFEQFCNQYINTLVFSGWGMYERELSMTIWLTGLYLFRGESSCNTFADDTATALKHIRFYSYTLILFSFKVQTFICYAFFYDESMLSLTVWIVSYYIA